MLISEHSQLSESKWTAQNTVNPASCCQQSILLWIPSLGLQTLEKLSIHCFHCRGLSSRALHKGFLCVSKQLPNFSVSESVHCSALTMLFPASLWVLLTHSASHCLQQAALSFAPSLSAFPKIHKSVFFTACDCKIAKCKRDGLLLLKHYLFNITY